MGKIRVRKLGEETLEKKQKKESKRKAEQKKLAKVPGLKGGQRVVAVGPSEEELAKLEAPKVEKVSEVSKEETKKKPRKTQKRTRSKKYQTIAKLVDKTKKYALSEALELLPKIHLGKFDETVELHINTTEAGVSATTTLPYGTGKKIRVAIADDELIAKIEKGLPASADAQASGRRGKIDFDVLLAEPSMMPKLAKVARFLGPRGLMPNPKSGTISQNPKELAKKYEGGQVTLKTEAKSPIMHLTIGKLSFGEKKLAENIQTILTAVKPQNIKNITIKSTMSPGIKIKL